MEGGRDPVKKLVGEVPSGERSCRKSYAVRLVACGLKVLATDDSAPPRIGIGTAALGAVIECI